MTSDLLESAAQQIVGREQREYVSQLTWCGEACFEFAQSRQLKRWACRFFCQLHEIRLVRAQTTAENCVAAGPEWAVSPLTKVDRMD
jgi:hypothetical protein